RLTFQPLASSTRAMQSPIAAARPWPTCSGPVGLAETYSTPAVRPWPEVLRPYSAPWRSTPATSRCQAPAARWKLMKPGPAISTFAMSSLGGNAATSAWASARGLVRAALASSIAALVAKSPCSRVLGRSITKSGVGASAGRVPATRRASIPWLTRAWRRIFTGDRFCGLVAHFTRSVAGRRTGPVPASMRPRAGGRIRCRCGSACLGPGSQPRHGVHVAGRARCRCRDEQFRVGYAGTVGDVDLAPAQGQAFVALVAHRLQRARRRRCVEEDGHGAVAGLVGEGVGGQHRGHLRRGTHLHAHRPARMGEQALLQRGPGPRRGGVAVEDHVAAGDVGPDPGAAFGLAHGHQLGHRQLAGAADIDRTQQGDKAGHGGFLAGGAPTVTPHRDGGRAQTSPRAAMETGSPSPTTKWSSRRTSTRARACFRRTVTARSAAEGSGQPDGWLWPTIT